MTIRDMQDQGVVFQGPIQIRRWSADADSVEEQKDYDGDEMGRVNDPLLCMDIHYMYSIDGRLIIEVEKDE